jgi:NTE family protein
MANIGLVLAGGFAKGAFQIGVLKALSELIGQDNTMYISSSSVGSLNAYAYAADKIQVMENIWREMDLKGVRSLFKAGVRAPYAYKVVDSLIDDGDLVKGYVYTTCFNMTKASLRYVKLHEVTPQKRRKYLKASVTLPLFSCAVEISGSKYYDGGIIDNIPILPLMKHPLDYVIVIHFDNHTYTFENEYFDNKLIKINFLDAGLLKNTLSFDKKSISAMLQAGYEQSVPILEMIFKNGADDLDYIYSKVAIYNALKNEGKLRITGDVVLNNINKFMKKVVSRQM